MPELRHAEVGTLMVWCRLLRKLQPWIQQTEGLLFLLLLSSRTAVVWLEMRMCAACWVQGAIRISCYLEDKSGKANPSLCDRTKDSNPSFFIKAFRRYLRIWVVLSSREDGQRVHLSLQALSNVFFSSELMEKAIPVLQDRFLLYALLELWDLVLGGNNIVLWSELHPALPLVGESHLTGDPGRTLLNSKSGQYINPRNTCVVEFLPWVNDVWPNWVGKFPFPFYSV